MKTLIPLLTSPPSPRVAPDFRGVSQVLLYDGATNVAQTLDLEPLRTVAGGLRTWMVDHGVSCVITAALLPLAQRAFEEVGIACYQAVGEALAPNLAGFCRCELERTALARAGGCSTSACGPCAGGCEPGARTKREPEA